MTTEQIENLQEQIRNYKAMKKGVEDRISDMQKKMSRLKSLVKEAYEEGYGDGTFEDNLKYLERDWNNSDICEKLNSEEHKI